MNGPWIRWFAALVIVSVSAGGVLAQDEPRDDLKSDSERKVLVELYTSQGCDMCPTAEKVLGALAERDRRIVPIAFHVDYFNDPWKDVFSDPLYSQRQMTYNQLYTKPKNREYGLYYTPMLMIDGEQSVNGRDPASAEAAIRQALARKPAVRLDVALDLKGDGLSGTATIKVTKPVGPGREVAALGLRRAPRGRRGHRHPFGREQRQVARRALPRAADEIRIHRTRRQVAHDATVPVRDRADLEASEPPAGRVRSGQAHRHHLPGDRPPVAIDFDRGAVRHFDSQGVAWGALKSRLMLLKDPRYVTISYLAPDRRTRPDRVGRGRIRHGVPGTVPPAGGDGTGPRVPGRHPMDQLRAADHVPSFAAKSYWSTSGPTDAIIA